MKKLNFAYCLKPLKKAFKSFPIINPNDRFKLLWDLFLIFMIFFNMFCLSIEVAFEPDFTFDEHYFIFKLFNIFVFSLDIALKFKSSFYEHGSLMKKHKKIRQNYLKKGFIIDFLGISALLINGFISAQNRFKWFIILFFGHFKTIKRIMINFENIVDFGDFFDLFSVMFKLLVIAHIYACIWHYIAYFQGKETTLTWLHLKNIENSSWLIKYLYSTYWALTTMVTVGYGDVTPQNPYEVFFCSFTILSGSMVFGYCLNRVGSLLTKIDERDHVLKYY